MRHTTLTRLRTLVLLFFGYLLIAGRTASGESFWPASLFQGELVALMTFAALTSESSSIVWISLAVGFSIDAMAGHGMGICAFGWMGSVFLVRRFRPYISNHQVFTQILSALFVGVTYQVLCFFALKATTSPSPMWISYPSDMFICSSLSVIILSPLTFKTASGWDLKILKKWRSDSAFRDNEQIRQHSKLSNDRSHS